MGSLPGRSQPVTEAHNRQETSLFAKSIERYALRNTSFAGAAKFIGRKKMLKEIHHESGTQQAALETITAHKEAGTHFAKIAPPPMSFWGRSWCATWSFSFNERKRGIT